MNQCEFTRIRNERIAQKTIESLYKRHFEAYYAETKEEVRDKAIEMIEKSDIVSWGGSMSLVQVGLIDYLLKNNYKVINRDKAANQEEKLNLLRQSLLCDTYLMGTNAITTDGQLVNVDSIGNRTAALMFGPKKVIIIASVKKIMPDIDSAIKRVRNIAAPINIQRIASSREIKTPCLETGKCHDCLSPDSICSHIVITRLCNPKNRIKIIITNEDIGF